MFKDSWAAHRQQKKERQFPDISASLISFFFKCKAALKLNIHVGSKSVSFFTGQLNGYSKIQTGCYDKDLNNTKDDTGIKGLET